MVESKFQAKLIKEIKKNFPGCVILKNDATYIQGFPDLLVLYKNRWACLEVKSLLMLHTDRTRIIGSTDFIKCRLLSSFFLRTRRRY